MDEATDPTGRPRRAVRPARPRSSRRAGGTTLRFLLILFVAALFLRTFIVAPFIIPSGSMLPRLMIGDYLFVSKWSYGYSRYSLPFGIPGFDGRILGSLPDRGDVVVFRYPGADEDYREAGDRPARRHGSRCATAS